MASSTSALSRTLLTPMKWRALSYMSADSERFLSARVLPLLKEDTVSRFETPQAPRACSPKFDWTFAEEGDPEVGESVVQVK